MISSLSASLPVVHCGPGPNHSACPTDQHASDEKYNFEMLQETTRIDSQGLIQCVTLV